jgi:pyruvate carboxylase
MWSAVKIFCPHEKKERKFLKKELYKHTLPGVNFMKLKQQKKGL